LTTASKLGPKWLSQKLLNIGVHDFHMQRMFEANSDVDSGATFRKEPAIVRSDHFVEDHLDVIRHEWHVLPPAHNALQLSPFSRLNREPRVSAIGDNRMLCTNGSAIVCHNAAHAWPIENQCLRFETRNKSNAEGDSPLKQAIVEYAPLTDDRRNIAAAGDVRFGIAGRHKAQSSDRIGLRCDLLPNAERLQDLNAFRRDSASARFVSRKIMTIHEHDILNSQLTETDDSGLPGRSCTDHKDVGHVPRIDALPTNVRK